MPNRNIKVRRAVDEDAQVLAHLAEATFTETFG
jgi:hypothetical protein